MQPLPHHYAQDAPEQNNMIPITQTEIGVDNPKANCLPAALASILEVGIERFEDVYQADWWMGVAQSLRPFKFVPVYYHVGGEPDFPPIAPPGYHVAIGQSPRSDKHTHACVALDGKIVFDPHPTRAGFVGEIARWILLMPLLESNNGA
jgi:hypothetical protein